MFLRSRYLLLILAVAGTFTLAYAQSNTPAANVNWRQFKGLLSHVGFNPLETTINRTNATSLSLA